MSRVGFSAAWVAFAALASCTVANPLYQQESDGGVLAPDLAFGHDGGTSAHDLGSPPILDLGPSCTPGARSCDAQGSVACSMTQMPVQDRICPSGSTCTDGYCAAPALQPGKVGTPCSAGDQASENLCLTASGTTATMSSCQPFVVAGPPVSIKWVCDAPVGAGVPGVPCISGSACRSGYCGSNGTCFRACVTDGECPTAGTQKFTCTEVGIIVEGQSVMAKSCIH